MRKIILMCLAASCYPSLAQDKYFEGILTYSIKVLDKNGDKKPIQFDKDKLFVSKTVILTEHTGPYIKNAKQLYLNIETKNKYYIDRDLKQITDSGIPKHEELLPIEEKIVGESVINGHPCIEHFIKYVHVNNLGEFSSIDTLRCSYFISNTFKFFQPAQFAKLQANKNSIILDGRFHGIPLKIMIRRNPDSTIIIENLTIEERNVDELVKLPNYPIFK